MSEVFVGEVLELDSERVLLHVEDWDGHERQVWIGLEWFPGTVAVGDVSP